MDRQSPETDAVSKNGTDVRRPAHVKTVSRKKNQQYMHVSILGEMQHYIAKEQSIDHHVRCDYSPPPPTQLKVTEEFILLPHETIKTPSPLDHNLREKKANIKKTPCVGGVSTHKKKPRRLYLA